MTRSDEGQVSSADPLRKRERPGFEVDAQSATWESIVFAITAGASVRYLEVPANEVALFLDAVDSGKLDNELIGLATTPTGAVLNAPNRSRKLAAFDRIVRQAIARVERDTSTGQLSEPGWQPRKRRRDDKARDSTDRQSEQPPQPSAQPVSATTQVAASTAPTVAAAVVVLPAAKRAWWSSPVAAVGAVVVVVAVAVVAVTLATRTRQDSNADATLGALISAPASTSPAPASGGSAGVSGASDGAGAVAAVDSTTTSVPNTSTATATLAASITASTAAPTVPRHPLEGSFALVRTVTDNSGNPAVPVGTTDTGTVTFTADCADPQCAVSSQDWGAASISGSQVDFSGTASEPCPDDPSIAVTDSWTITLQTTGQEAGAVTSLQGTGTLTSSELNGCSAQVYPLTSSYALTRTG